MALLLLQKRAGVGCVVIPRLSKSRVIHASSAEATARDLYFDSVLDFDRVGCILDNQEMRF